jgi:hypothetical protein
MKMTTRTITQQCVVNAAPDVVAAAIASPHGLSAWLCDSARSEKKADGRLALQWHDGRQSTGRWTIYEPPERLGWHSQDDIGGPEHTVTFELSPEGDGTKVTASEGDVPDGGAEAVTAQWNQTLDDLKLFVEQGLNGRELRQPMLGIMPEEVDAEGAAKIGVPVESGMRISGLVDDGAAKGVGMLENDVIVAIDDNDISDWPSLGSALRAHQAGDTVNVKFWRGNEEHHQPVTLKPRDVPDLPDTVDGIKEMISAYTADTLAKYEDLLAGVTDEEAGKKPAEGEWSAKEVLVHLSLSERYGYDWLLRTAGDGQPLDWPGEVEELLHTAMADRPLAELHARLKEDMRDAEDLCMAILDDDPSTWIKRSVAMNAFWGPMHIDDHIAQIKAAIEAARS